MGRGKDEDDFDFDNDFQKRRRQEDETGVAGDIDFKPEVEPKRGTRIIQAEGKSGLDEEGLFSWLVAVEGDYRGKLFQIFAGQNLIGRAERCHIRLKDDFVSELHAVIKVETDKYIIWDLGSANGTQVNGEALTSARELKDGDRIVIGKQKFVFKRVEPEKKQQ